MIHQTEPQCEGIAIQLRELDTVYQDSSEHSSLSRITFPKLLTFQLSSFTHSECTGIASQNWFSAEKMYHRVLLTVHLLHLLLAGY